MRRRRSSRPLLALLTAAAAALTLASPAAGYVFSPYLDMTSSPSPDLPAVARASGARHLTLGFVVTPARGWCSPTWSGYLKDPAWGANAYAASQVARLEAAHIGVAISFGGEFGAEPAEGCLTRSALTAAYSTIIDAYHPARLDFDIEGAALNDTAATVRRAEVLAAIQRDAAAGHHRLYVSFTLPATPAGLTPSSQALLRETVAQGVRIDYVNLMTMDFGGGTTARPAGQIATDAIDAATAAAGQLRPLFPRARHAAIRHMIGLTPMIGINDNRTVFTLEDARRLAAAARAEHAGLVSMWQLARDGSCPATMLFAQAYCSGVTERQFQFARTLGAGAR